MNKQEQMQAFKKITGVIKDVLQEDMDVAVYLTDTEKCVSYYPSKSIDAGVRSGDVIRSDEPVYDIIHKKKSFHQEVSKEVFGVPFRGIGHPIIDDNGEVLGSFAISRSLQQEEVLEKESHNLFSSLEEVNASVEEVANNTQTFAEYIENIQKLSQSTTQDIQKADAIVSSIQSVASQSNLLALNATIEAARVGAAGRAFSVVAEEMKNLSKTSKESADAVATMLSEMKVSIENIAKQIESIADKAKTQASSTEQILASVQEVTRSSEKLLSLAQ